MDIDGKIANDCQTAKDLFSRFENQNLTYDADSIASLDAFINRNRAVFDDATIQRMIMIFGAFLGEAVRRNFGGKWDEINGEVGIRFDEKNAIFPFSKVRKHFENGSEDSILSFYQVIPMVSNFRTTRMLKQAVEYYHSLLEDHDLASESHRILQEGLTKNRLIFGGRPLSPYLRPHFITFADWARVKITCETIWSALQKVKDAAVADDAILDELGVTQVERELVKIDPGYKQVSPTSRLDSFLTDDAYSYVELNGESPAGIAYADSATAIFESLPVMQKFRERYEVLGFSGRPLLLEVLLECWDEFCGGKADRKPVIAIVDLKDLPTQKEFELFRDYFEEQGYDAVICSPYDLEFDDGKLYFGGVQIDVVYKRLLVNEYLPIMNEAPALVDAYRARSICMVNSFRGKLVHKKAIFAVLTNERYAHLFNEAEQAAIADHVPWTRKFRDEQTINGDDEIDLVEWTRANASKLVLKPNDDYGGHGIYIGWNSSEIEWDAAMETALSDGDYLVQQRVSTAKEMFPMIFDEHGKWGMIEQLVDLDPLLFNGVVGAAFTRLSSSELANVSSGGGMVPTFIIQELK